MSGGHAEYLTPRGAIYLVAKSKSVVFIDYLLQPEAEPLRRQVTTRSSPRSRG